MYCTMANLTHDETVLGGLLTCSPDREDMPVIQAEAWRAIPAGALDEAMLVRRLTPCMHGEEAVEA